jgi:predicted RNA-binding Zn-ribbon protein involved in translation (DUF1610 family)
MDYEIDYDEQCPKCGNSPIHWRRCYECDDGYRDMFEEDPLWYDIGETERCPDCLGYGTVTWCPECGYNITEHNYVMDLLKEQDDTTEKETM